MKTNISSLIGIILLYCTILQVQADDAGSFDILFSKTETLKPCCDKGENILNGNKCKGNYSISLNCANGKFILDPYYNSDDGFFIDEYKNLIDNETNTVMAGEGDYCITNRSSKEIAVVCFSEDLTLSSTNELLAPSICLSISVFFLIITFVIYCNVKDLRDLQGKCFMHMIINLSISFLILVILQRSHYLTSFWCSTTAFLLYISMMATFFWLNVVSFNVWRLVRLKNIQTADSKLYWIYCLYAYGLGGILFTITLVLYLIEGDHLSPGIGTVRCWFAGVTEIWTFFYGPVLLLLAINLGLYIDTVYLLWSNYKSMAADSMHCIKSHRYKCLLCIKLFLVMGISWIFEPLSYLFTRNTPKQRIIWMIIDYINMLQGITIFIILIATRKRALRGLARMTFCGFRLFPIYFATLSPDDECDDIMQNIEESTLAPQPQNV